MKKITEFQIKISPQNVCAMLDADRSSLEEEMREARRDASRGV